MKTAVFPGSFDPLTNGHIDIIKRSLTLFDTVVVAVLVNSSKTNLLPVADRVKLIRTVLAPFKGRVQVRAFNGLLVDFLRSIRSPIVIRGLRAISDYDYETQLALMNKNLWDKVETVFLVAREENSYISSTIVKQVAFLGGDISRFVPPAIARIMRKHSQAASGPDSADARPLKRGGKKGSKAKLASSSRKPQRNRTGRNTRKKS